MEFRDLIYDHMESMDQSIKMLRTVAIPDRHVDVDRPGDTSPSECKAFAQEG